VHNALTGAPFRPPPGPRQPIMPQSPSTPLSRHMRDERPAETRPLPIRPQPPDRPAPHPPVPERPRAMTWQPLQDSHKRTPEQGDEITGFSSLGILGRIPGSFLVLYNADELVIMDQHAAHERVLFERLVRDDRDGRRSESQQLLIPTVMEYSPLEARALASHLDLLQGTGFQIEEFGENAFVVKGVPPWFKDQEIEPFFSALIESMLDTGLRGDANRLRQELLKTMACRTAIKESKAMPMEEIRALLNQLDNAASPDVCPHGRPLVLRFPLKELRKKMGRK